MLHKLERGWEGKKMVKVTITTADGKVYTDPSKIHVPRTPNTEMFYSILENYKPPKKKKEEGTA